VGSLKVSGLSMRPSPTESHGVDVSKFRKAEISDTFHGDRYLELIPMVQQRHVSSRCRNVLQYTPSTENLSVMDAVIIRSSS
jgi:hypothetical protein